MRTVRIKVYQFSELNDNAKQLAIENFRNNQELHLDFFQSDCVEQIEEKGFYGNIQLQYSLSYSQGDGLSFSCGHFQESFLLPIFEEILGKGKEQTAKIIMANSSFENVENKGRYCYASKNDISYEFDNGGYKDYVQVHSVVSKVEEKLKDIYINLCKVLERNGYSVIEYQNSDEAIIENFEANGYEFLASGKIFSN